MYQNYIKTFNKQYSSADYFLSFLIALCIKTLFFTTIYF
ncbi:hypothetical protein SAMN05216436_1395 [bacterium A37T11]|nr:hypothetical protein SAMN05216436_1395 [bacterium A37T11]